MAERDLFPGFERLTIATPAGEIFARKGGSGPPLLCLHGFPQTHHCWHKIADGLARHFTVIAADLRGYGASFAPVGDAEHHVYSKRAMGDDCRALMTALGFEKFALLGHDRGARVGYRLALDHPEIIMKLAVLDILPTGEVWTRISAGSAISAYHWQFLARPKPFPETLIGAAPRFFADETLKSWTKIRALDDFATEALDAYRAMFDEPARIHAMCEDYRSGAIIDRAIDDNDKAHGKRIACPVFALWGSDYVGKDGASPLDIWASWCTALAGQEIDSGHFLAEENPAATLSALLPFLAGTL